MKRIAVLCLVVTAAACGKSGDKKADDKGKQDDKLSDLETYKRKSMTTEAKVMLHRLYTSARAYYEERGVWPASAPMTPAVGSCCRGPDHKCAPDPATWSDASWKALDFSMDDPHQYSYEMITSTAGFTARAIGDLDCDGDFGTFELRVTMAADGTPTMTEFKDHDLE